MEISANRSIKKRFPKSRYMRPAELCRHLNIGASTLWNWVKLGKCPKPIKPSAGVSIFDRAEIKAWLENGRPKAALVEPNTNHVNIEQLVAFLEARQFPIGVDFTDPLARRLYDACSVLMCHASINGRQASIARRHINTAMSEMGNNQGGYYHLKKCLEEMNAQEQGETPAVVLCQQYSKELTEHLAELGSLDSLVGRMRASAERMALRGLSDEAEEMSDGALVIKALMEFVGAPSRPADGVGAR